MKPLHAFKIGSNVFFSNYQDYEMKDCDYIAIMDFYPFKENVMKMQIGTDDIFMYRPNITKQDFLDDLYSSNVPMKAGKFLIPEFCKHIGFTIEDLKKLEWYFVNMDDKHKYEKLIYDAYLENNDFVLTDKQRIDAFNEYKKERLL